MNFKYRIFFRELLHLLSVSEGASGALATEVENPEHLIKKKYQFTTYVIAC